MFSQTHSTEAILERVLQLKKISKTIIIKNTFFYKFNTKKKFGFGILQFWSYAFFYLFRFSLTVLIVFHHYFSG